MIDDTLHATYQKQTRHPPAIGSEIRNVQDSPVFRNLFHNQPNPYNLIFGIYIDFYSVFKMKIAGEFKPNETENYHLQFRQVLSQELS